MYIYICIYIYIYPTSFSLNPTPLNPTVHPNPELNTTYALSSTTLIQNLKP